MTTPHKYFLFSFSAALKVIITQNVLVITCAIIIMCTMNSDLKYFQREENQWIFYIIKTAIIFFGASAYLASMASSICISKDWVVVICHGDKELLAKINATCRCIDLTTKIASPFLVGLIMAQMSDFVAAAFIASWNIFSMIFECLIIRSIYKSVPLLAKPKVRQTKEEISIMQESAEENKPNPEPQFVKTGACIKMKKQIVDYFNLWTSYVSHSIFPAGFGLACLYMTVLGFDGITIGYAYSQGVTEYILGILGGAGAITGIVGTIFYPMLRKKIGIERTGLIGFFALVSCLVPCIVSIWVPGSPFRHNFFVTHAPLINKTFDNGTDIDVAVNSTAGTLFNPTNTMEERDIRKYISIALLMAGITAARFGLWLIDLTVNQIVQEEVEEQQRGAINGTQHALNMAMDLIKYGLVILFPSPEMFGFLILASFTTICLGWGSYAVYSFRKRHHILPFHQYFKNCAPVNVPNLQSKDLS